MWEKIKSSSGILIRGTFGGWMGGLGALMIGFSVYLCVGLFTGTASIQNYFRHRRDLRTADAKIANLQKRLDAENLHIKLLQEHSPDFVQEMGIKYLNLGDPAVRIIKK